VQARPATVKSREHKGQDIERYDLNESATGLVEGRSIGQKVG